MEEKILEILEDICEEDLKDKLDVDIFEEGMLDSLSMVKFIVEIEEQLNISIGIMEMDKEVVNTPRKIIDFIKNRK
jgi:hypothetical protein